MEQAMSSRHLSLRVESKTLEALDAQSRRLGQSRSQRAKTLLDEGLTMETHPGIIFRGGPAGRRAGLMGGPDVWEVARVLGTLKASGDQVIEQTAELTGLSPEQVRIALRYYADHGNEIDAWIARVDAEAEEAESSWRREQDILAR